MAKNDQNRATAPDSREEALASFHVRITSVCDATWQGIVEADGKQHHFQSELQLLHWVLEQFPTLQPRAVWETDE